MGLRIYSIDNSGFEPQIAWGGPSMSVWYPAVADLFNGHFWAADNAESTPFIDVTYEYSEETFDSLIVKGPPTEYSAGPILFKPEAMDRYYRFVRNDWIYLYGIAEVQTYQVLSQWRDEHINDFLLDIADPFIRNYDGGYWDLFTIHVETARQRLDSLNNLKVVDVALSDWE